MVRWYQREAVAACFIYQTAVRVICFAAACLNYADLLLHIMNICVAHTQRASILPAQLGPTRLHANE